MSFDILSLRTAHRAVGLAAVLTELGDNERALASARVARALLDLAIQREEGRCDSHVLLERLVSGREPMLSHEFDLREPELEP